MEEINELIDALTTKEVHEAADVVYHLLVLLNKQYQN